MKRKILISAFTFSKIRDSKGVWDERRASASVSIWCTRNGNVKRSEIKAENMKGKLRKKSAWYKWKGFLCSAVWGLVAPNSPKCESTNNGAAELFVRCQSKITCKHRGLWVEVFMSHSQQQLLTLEKLSRTKYHTQRPHTGSRDHWRRDAHRLGLLSLSSGSELYCKQFGLWTRFPLENREHFLLQQSEEMPRGSNTAAVLHTVTVRRNTAVSSPVRASFFSSKGSWSSRVSVSDGGI